MRGDDIVGWLAAAALLLLAIGNIVDANGAGGVGCSRNATREARHRISEVVSPILADFGVAIPPECPMHPSQDMYSDQDANRTEHSIYVGCGVCGKYFHTDAYLDAHFDRKHTALLVGHACLTDHCTVLQCPSVAAGRNEGGSGGGSGGEGSRSGGEGSRAAEDKERKVLCRALLAQCFPPASSPKGMLAALHAALCVPRLDAPQPRPSTLLTSLTYLGSALLVVAVGGFYAASALRHAYASGVSAGDLHVRQQGPRGRWSRAAAPVVTLLRKLTATSKQRRD